MTRSLDAFVSDEDGAACARRRLARAALFLGFASIFFGGLDAISTELALSLTPAREANPLMHALQEQIGSAWTTPKMLVHGLIALVVIASPCRYGLAGLSFLTCLTAAAAAHNLALCADYAAVL